jgi:hypothetical protein
MGEIADMMLDGTMCEGCGVFLDEPPMGIPNYCSEECANDRGMTIKNGYPEPLKKKKGKR